MSKLPINRASGLYVIESLFGVSRWGHFKLPIDHTSGRYVKPWSPLLLSALAEVQPAAHPQARHVRLTRTAQLGEPSWLARNGSTIDENH